MIVNLVIHGIQRTALTFSGSTITSGKGDVVYYYGTSEDSMTSTGTSTESLGETNSTTYYVKACNSEYTSICSRNVSYILKIDGTAPVVTSVSASETALSVTVTESGSGVSSVCINTSSTSTSG